MPVAANASTARSITRILTFRFYHDFYQPTVWLIRNRSWAGATGGWPGLLISLELPPRWVPRPLRTCEGREPRTRMQLGLGRDKTLCRQHRHPPLQKTQGRGTPSPDVALDPHR